jgi:hypothetical protein
MILLNSSVLGEVPVKVLALPSLLGLHIPFLLANVAGRYER